MKYVFLSFLWLAPFASFGQRAISGQITDAETGYPIPDVSVFIANTTKGTTTGADGVYQLKLPGRGVYKIVFSHVGYLPVLYDIHPDRSTIRLDAAMEIREMEETVVCAKKQYRARDVSLFWRTILGRNPSYKTVYAVNSAAVYFHYNPETKILKATCREPLKIINNLTGYQTHYILEYFTHNYTTNFTLWSGQHKFDELDAKSAKEKTVWENNRRKVYSVSIRYFIRSLYRNSLHENGFLLSLLDQNVNVEQPWNVQILEGNVCLSEDSIGNHKILDISADSVVMLTCFGKKNGSTDIYRLNTAKKRTQWSLFGLYRNRITTPQGLVRVFSDGTFDNFIEFSPVFASNVLTGLDMMLPIEYNPDKTSKDE